MNETIEKIKAKIEEIKIHVSDNKRVYIGTATGVAIGVIGTLVYCLETGKFNKMVIAKQDGENLLQCVGDNNKIYQRISYLGNVIGRPGEPVLDMITGKRYASKSLAARDVGATNSQLSAHLKGERDLNGHMFVPVSDWVEQFLP